MVVRKLKKIIKNGVEYILSFVDLETNQSVDWVKTFVKSPIVPSPINNTDAATKKYVDDKKSTISVTLTAIGWSSNSQTVSATGVTASNTVIVSSVPADMDEYTSNKVKCSAQGSWTLTFECDTVPSNDIDVNVVILG